MPAVNPILLVVLDGWGYSEGTTYNAIHAARTPWWDEVWQASPHTLISASGIDVGLPELQMGNSEVGHMHIGAGRTIAQDLTRISEAIEEGDFADNAAFHAAIDTARDSGKALHLVGLLSPGGVHSHQDHTLALLELAAARGLREVYIHAFLDGRDVPPKSAAESLAAIVMKSRELGIGRIASLIGRFYGMDRNKNWSRTEAAYNLIVSGRATNEFNDALVALDEAYKRGESDEFLTATAIHVEPGQPVTVNDGDAVICTNFRADRARQLTEAFLDPEFDRFRRLNFPEISRFVTMTEYREDFSATVAFPNEDLANTIGEVLSQNGLHQLRVAETEKYAHVTFFLNGGREQTFTGEERVLIPSPPVKTYDEAPAMSAREVTETLLKAMRSGRFQAIVCNYANADMVGHTGNFEAAIEAVEVLDECMARVHEAARQAGFEIVLTADHGNIERMRSIGTRMQPDQPHTAHTSNPVPVLYLGEREVSVAPSGSLADIAPTVLTLMGLPVPEEMTGHSLVRLEHATNATTVTGPADPAIASA